ncbi:MAG: YopX family protein [Eubacteriales bacterium]|nr:YopX family protein [Eubacteriales bacterium]
MADKEILFRARRLDNKKWAEGFYVCDLDTGECYILSGRHKEGKSAPEKWRVFPETLCRYSGFADKHGKRIWEHDLVRAYEISSKEWMINEAVYSYGCFKLVKEGYCDALLCRYMPQYLEVTGNCFD